MKTEYRVLFWIRDLKHAWHIDFDDLEEAQKNAARPGNWRTVVQQRDVTEWRDVDDE